MRYDFYADAVALDFLERNRMTYQSGGVTVDLERRADAVKQLIAVYQRQWIDGMSQMKTKKICVDSKD